MFNVRWLPGLWLRTSIFFFCYFRSVSHRCSRACQACVIGSRRKSSAGEEAAQTTWCLTGKKKFFFFLLPLLLISAAHKKKEKRGKIQRRSCRTMPKETLIVEKGGTVTQSRISESSASGQKKLRPAGLGSDLVMHGTLSAARPTTSRLSSCTRKPYLGTGATVRLQPLHVVFLDR